MAKQPEEWDSANELYHRFGNLRELDAQIPALVGAVLRDLKPPHQEYEDLRQEGLLAGLRAVRTWDPQMGAFSTHVSIRVAGALRKYLRSGQSMVRVPWNGELPPPDLELNAPDIDEPETEAGGPLDRLTYADPPRGFGDPGIELGRQTAADSVDRLLDRGSQESAVLRCLYGVGRDPESIRDLSFRTGISKSALGRTAQEGLKNLGQKQNAGDNAPTGRVNAEPEKGRVRRSAVSADRFPGFWNDSVGGTASNDESEDET